LNRLNRDVLNRLNRDVLTRLNRDVLNRLNRDVLNRLKRDVLTRLNRDVLNWDGTDQILPIRKGGGGERPGLGEPTWWGNKMLCIQRFG
jgi:hypothetical protein